MTLVAEHRAKENKIHLWQMISVAVLVVGALASVLAISMRQETRSDASDGTLGGPEASPNWASPVPTVTPTPPPPGECYSGDICQQPTTRITCAPGYHSSTYSWCQQQPKVCFTCVLD